MKFPLYESSVIKGGINRVSDTNKLDFTPIAQRRNLNKKVIINIFLEKGEK